ncbi:MAG TPA: E3 binding domain-containing protein, partial [Acidimicrobiia bacterium]|nr:E3 binding domain-containing protein [Acidimicrobiia bacterium]
MATVHPARLRPPRRTRPGFRSPAVRRLVTEHRVEPGTIIGTGTAGRVTRDDVLARAAGTKPDDTDETVALNRIQRKTGANLLRSLHVAPHAFIAMEVDFEVVDRARRTKKLSYLPFVARALVDAVAEY